jgi:hypothetical protein
MLAPVPVPALAPGPAPALAKAGESGGGGLSGVGFLSAWSRPTMNRRADSPKPAPAPVPALAQAEENGGKRAVKGRFQGLAPSCQTALV